MRMRLRRSITLLLVASSQLSCAAAGLAPATRSQTAERMGLAPEYRIFYDALEGEGDWVYIQPMGYVFRPDVNFLVWRPYEDGFWAPSEIYGWTWISAEPFGWATYHYGSGLYDRYFGWVWAPGRDWGPAWVAWQIADDNVGWSPLLSPGPADDQIRGGAWTYAPLSMLGSTSLASHVVHETDLSGPAQGTRPVRNLEERGGVVFNRGPSFELVEKAAGSLPRVKLEGLEPGALPGGGAGAHLGGARGSDKTPPQAVVIESTRNAAEDAARTARALVTRGGPPPASLPMIRPSLPPPSAEAKPGPARRPTWGRARGDGRGAAPDTTAR